MSDVPVERPDAGSWDLAAAQWALEATTDAFVLFDRELRIVHVNGAFARGAGAPAEEFVGKTQWELWPELRGTVVEQRYRTAFETGEPQHFEFLHDKSGLWLEIHAHPREGRLAVFFRDVTASKTAATEAQNREATLRRLLDAIPHIAWATLPDGRMSYINARWAEYTGVDGMDVGMIRKTIHPEDLPRVVETMSHSRKTGEYHAYDLRLRRYDGEYRWHRVLPGPLLDGEGRIEGWIGTSSDVHDEVTAAEAIRESEERIRLALSATGMGTWEVNVRTEEAKASPDVAALYGKPPGFAHQSTAEWLAMVHPDDRERLAEARRRLFVHGEPYDQEFRVPQEDGSVRWLYSKASLFRDEAGEPWKAVGVVSDITARKQAEAAIRASEERFRAAVGVVGILWTNNSEGKMEGEQPGWAAITGQSQDEYQGYGWTGAIHPDEIESTLAAWSEAVAERRTFAFEHRVRSHDGRWRRYAVRAVPVFDAGGAVREWVGVHFDVHEQRSREAVLNLLVELADRTRELRDPVEVMRVSITLLGSHLGASRCAYAEVEEDGETFEIVDAYANGVPPMIGRFQLSGLGDEVAAQQRAGKPTVVEDVRLAPETLAFADPYESVQVRAMICFPLMKEGKLTAMVGVHSRQPRAWTDEEVELVKMVADRCWSTIERARAARALKAANAELEERVLLRTADLEASNEALQGFTYHVSHDLRTPLRAIAATSRMLQDDFGQDLPEEANRLLARQSEAANKLGRLIDDLLRLSRLSREELVKQCVDVTSIAREAAAEAVASHPDTAVRVAVQEGMQAEADPRLLKLALLNLIENAVKYSPSGGQVVVGCRDDGSFYVSDQGIGIDAPYLDKIFEPFQRLHRDEEFRGTGIGLTNVRQVVVRHGGRIWVESEPGKGSTFRFTLAPSARLG